MAPPSGPLTDSLKNERSSRTPCGVCAYLLATARLTVEGCTPTSSATSLIIIGFTAAIQLMKNIEQRKHTILRLCPSIRARHGDDRLADVQNRLFALLDIFHQLDRGGEAFFDVVANVTIARVFDKQAAIRRAQAKLRHIIFVEEGLPLVVNLAEVDVGLDEARLGLVVAQ